VGAQRAADAAERTRDSIASALHIESLTREQLLDLLFKVVREAKAGDALVAAARTSLSGSPINPDDVKWTGDAVDGAEEYKSDAGNAARAALSSARSEETRFESELSTLRNDGTTDFGPDAVFFPLKGKCFDLRVNQYTYQACPFGNAKQDSVTLG